MHFRMLAVSTLVVLMFSARTIAAQCETTLSDDEKALKPVLAELRAEPFAVALAQYVNQVAAVDRDLDQWKQDAEAFDPECKSIALAQDNLNRDVSTHNGRCSGTTTDRGVLESCQQSANSLNARQAEIDRRNNQLNANQAALNARGSVIGNRATEAVTAARAILDKNHVGDAFRLYALLRAGDVGAGRMTSCAAMADMFNALGRKVDWDLDFIAFYTGQVLTNGVSLRDITAVPPGPRPAVGGFTASGFRREYVDLPGDNQVRHFVGYFVAGVKLPTAQVAWLLTQLRDANEPGDYALGVYAVNLADQVKGSPRRLGGAIHGTCR